MQPHLNAITTQLRTTTITEPYASIQVGGQILTLIPLRWDRPLLFLFSKNGPTLITTTSPDTAIKGQWVFVLFFFGGGGYQRCSRMLLLVFQAM